MLKLLNTLSPFFEDNYVRLGVREYGRLKDISPPTSSSMLESLRKDGLLFLERERRYKLYSANREGAHFRGLMRLYWQARIEKSGLLEEIERKCIAPVAILYGSLANAEAQNGSDVDIALFTVSQRKVETAKAEKILKRSLQLMTFRDRMAVKNKELLSNILNGHRLIGEW